MKQLLVLLTIALLSFTACYNPPAGTKHPLHSENSEIELYKYYYDESGNFVYVARFKDQPKVSTTTWEERQGKYTYTKALVSQ